MTTKPVKAIVIHSTDHWTVRDIAANELQSLVGGRLESVTAECDDKRDPSTILWCSREGEQESLPLNMPRQLDRSVAT